MNKILICLLIATHMVTFLGATEEVCASSVGVGGSGLGLARGAAVNGLRLGTASRSSAAKAAGAAGAASAAAAVQGGSAKRVAGCVATATAAAADQASSAKVLAAGAKVATQTLADAARKVALQIVITANSAESKIDAASTDTNAAVRKAFNLIDGICTATIKDLQQTVNTIVLGLQGTVKKTTAEINIALDSALIAIGTDLLTTVATAEESVARVGRNVAKLIQEGANDIARHVISTSIEVSSNVGRQAAATSARAEGGRQEVRASQLGMVGIATAANTRYGSGIPA